MIGSTMFLPGFSPKSWQATELPDVLKATEAHERGVASFLSAIKAGCYSLATNDPKGRIF